MADNCSNKKVNLGKCNCTYSPCARKGICCECLEYHRKNNELPACFFSKDVEKSYDRSFDMFVKNYKNN